ncbi:TetR/AcrR family transcriptional regulator [Mycobacterium sp.]|uniref:TetR/AcrR family transcriptional regulator n=1 Tax=Mycobacterium sp. TaxID=1785 RepID=UPI0033417682
MCRALAVRHCEGFPQRCALRGWREAGRAGPAIRDRRHWCAPSYLGKTAAERVAERRERLIDAGVELFDERGYAAASIRSVLQQSGLRDRYFGESFADLDSLLAAVYSRLIDEEISGCAAVIDKTSGGSESTRAMIDTITRSFEKNPGKARIKSREVLSGGPVAREQRRAGLRRLAQLVADLLPASTALNRSDVLLLGLSIVAAADELLLTWMDSAEGLTRDRVVDVVTLLFDATAHHISST